MSETIRLFRGHLDKWQLAYIKWICLCFMGVFTYLHSEFKAYQTLTDISMLNWIEMFCWSIVTVATTTVAFIDKSAQTPKEEQKPVDYSTINK